MSIYRLRRNSSLPKVNGNIIEVVSTNSTGGSIYSPGNGSTYHVFTAASPFTFTAATRTTYTSEQSKVIKTTKTTSIEVFVVAGGGGGGQTIGGGGGAGGVVYHYDYPVTNGTVYSGAVGSGGPGAPGNVSTYSTGRGSPGGNTTFGALTAVGGGGGGNYDNSSNDAGPGGSAGGTGAGINPNIATASQPTQPQPGVPANYFQYGNVGGSSQYPTSNNGGGGGGASTSGGNGADHFGGRGIIHTQFSGSLIGIPQTAPFGGNYAEGGGGGGRNPGGTAGPTLAGGGAGGNGTTGSNAVTNTGSGGGGGGYTDSAGTSWAGGNGAPGIVIVRYQNLPYANSNPKLYGTLQNPFESPQQAQNLGYPSGFYYFKSSQMSSPQFLQFENNYYESKSWVCVFRSQFASAASVNKLDLNIKMGGLLVQRDILDQRAAVYWSTPILYNTTSTSGDNTADSGYSPRRVILGYAGGHGIYNTGQQSCSWSNSSGSIGAGFDGSCGTFPDALRWGTGTGSAIYSNMQGTWSHWIYWS